MLITALVTPFAGPEHILDLPVLRSLLSFQISAG
ncbi:MAG: dihydrodipicolinate synthase/N-acetylneuraminate lyase, partial [Pseudohongiellaceae bacterium]